MSVISFIEHYQRSIKKSEDDENRLLHCLEKLSNLHVKVSDLQATGIGRTVNSLRKKPGKVGETARSLVTTWMKIVESNMTEDEEAQEQSGDEGHAKENGYPDSSPDVKRVFVPENGTKEFNVQDCIDKSKTIKTHHTNKTTIKEEPQKEEKSRHRHNQDDGKKIDHKSSDARHTSIDHRHDSSKSRHKSNKDDKERDRHSSSKRHREDKSPKKAKKESFDEDLDTSSSKKQKILSDSDPFRIKEERLSPVTIAERKPEKHNHSLIKVKKERDVASSSRDNKKTEDLKIKLEDESHPRKTKIKTERPSPEPREKRDKHSKASSSKSRSNVKVKKEVKQETMDSDESDHDMNGNAGTSFADALGTLDYTPTKKPKEKKKKIVPKSAGFKPLPRSEDLASLLDLPALTYRPLPQVPHRSAKPVVSDPSAFADVIKNKNQRTKVYSGTKAFQGEVPTLQDICVKILQENVDAFEHVGSVPFYLLEPIFNRASATQLARIEHYNPQFFEELDVLWESLVNSEFKTAKKLEDECWRDVYERSLGEREEKMNQIAAKIKANNEARKAPQRTTKLAFEHSLAKPPRGVRKQQEKHGTARGSLPMKVAKSYDSGEAGPSGLPSSRDRESTLARTVGLLRDGPSMAIKSKKRPAPLMQKTLKFMKTNYRR